MVEIPVSFDGKFWIRNHEVWIENRISLLYFCYQMFYIMCLGVYEVIEKPANAFLLFLVESSGIFSMELIIFQKVRYLPIKYYDLNNLK